MAKDLLKVFLNTDDSIKTALDKLAFNKADKTSLPGGIVLIVDKNKRLLGIATDGDIRRALSNGISLKAKISEVMNRNPFLIEGPKPNTEIFSLAVDKIRKENWHRDRLNKIIVVDKSKKVLDLVSFYDLWRQSDVRFKHIGIVGLGYVGLTLGLTLADLGFKVKGYDKNPNIRLSLERGKPHFVEAGLNVLIKDHLNKNFKVVENFKGENNCDVYFICVGTPLNKERKPDLDHLTSAAKSLGKSLKQGDAVILRSTVPIGATRNLVVPILQRTSGFKTGEEFLVAFAPERTIEGNALEELRKLPQVIGGFNHASTDLAVSIFSFMTNSTILVESLEEAEAVKLINNTYRDVTFAYANEIAMICQKWGIDTHRVINAANNGYERSSVPKPSPGVGGYCLEKDPFIFIESARSKNYDPLLLLNARKISAMMIDWVAGEISAFLKNHKSGFRNPKILILGFAFKGRPITSDVRDSTTIKLVQKLRQAKFNNFYCCDPAVRRADVIVNKVKYIADPKAGFKNADAVVVMNNNPYFEKLDIRNLMRFTSKPALLFDSWALYSKEEVLKVKGVIYRRL